jgi:hypothetical protein
VKLGVKTFRDKRRLRVFEHRMLRKIFGHKRDEVTGGWRREHNEKNEMGGACSTYRGKERCMQVFGGENPNERDYLDDPG